MIAASTVEINRLHAVNQLLKLIHSIDRERLVTVGGLIAATTSPLPMLRP